MEAKVRLAVQGAAMAGLRLAFFALLYMGALASDSLTAVILFVCAAAVLVFFLMPGRFMLGRILRGGQYVQDISYPLVLKLGLVRLGRGLLYGVPVLLLLSYVLNRYHTVNGQEFGRMIKRFSWFLFQAPENTTPDVGIIGFLVPVALLSLYFVLGWRQDMAMEYVAQPDSVKDALLSARKVRERGEGRLVRVSLGNAVLCLVSFAGMAAVLLLSVLPELKAADGMFALIQTALELMDRPLSAGTLAALAAVYLVVCAPLCMIRKIRLARAVQETEWGMV